MKKHKTKSLKRTHRGGAIYSFDLNDKIGGLPARIPLNGTQDGDCPASDTKDLGFVNYGATKGGARRKQKSSRHSKHVSKSRKNKSRKHKSKSRTNRRK